MSWGQRNVVLKSLKYDSTRNIHHQNFFMLPKIPNMFYVDGFSWQNSLDALFLVFKQCYWFWIKNRVSFFNKLWHKNNKTTVTVPLQKIKSTAFSKPITSWGRLEMLDFVERGQLDCEKRLILASKKKKNMKKHAKCTHMPFTRRTRVCFNFARTLTSCPHSYLSTETRHALRAI